MDWGKLLSKERLVTIERPEEEDYRSAYQRDFDRIVFSAAFRRMQDKTQVFPFSESDYTRTRLTHSLEVSCVGRSLGTKIGRHVLENNTELRTRFHESDFGAIVSAACLAHDIGNPPLGHSGEEAIRHWFRTSDSGKNTISNVDSNQANDFLEYEGNAQGFRHLVRLQNRGLNKQHEGGLKLTCAVLAAFTKYPRFSMGERKNYQNRKVCSKKYGIFYDENEYFKRVADKVGLISTGDQVHKEWCRHPLAFLVEAADDICYQLLDLEDGCKLKHVTQEEAEDLFISLIGEEEKTRSDLDRFSRFDIEKLEHLRAIAIHKLVDDVCQCFSDNEQKILSGELDEELVALVDANQSFSAIKRINKEKVYKARSVLEIEAGGYEVIDGLLEAYVTAVNDVAENEGGAESKSKKLLELLPEHCVGTDNIPVDDQYIRTLKVIDFVSGMTDSFAVNHYRKIKGMTLPR